MESRTQYNFVTSPLWWGCFAALVLNDHVLKHADVLPSLITGKLSDFAGLVVAPALLAMMLGLRSRPARIASVVAVFAGFALINLSQGAASWVESTTAAIGVPWRIWVDPTDLIAFLVAPWAFAMTASKPRSSANPVISLQSKLALTVGLIACIATTGGAGIRSTAFLVNATNGQVDVRVRRLPGQVNCELVRENLALLVNSDASTAESTRTLFAGDIMALGRLARSSEECEVALLEVNGADPVAVFFEPAELEEQEVFGPDDIEPETKLTLGFADEDGIEFRLNEPEESLLTLAVGVEGPGSRCQPTREGGLDASFESVVSGTTAALASVFDQGNGCFELVLEEGGNEATLYVCAPVPFEAGDTVSIEHGGGLLRIVGEEGPNAGASLEAWSRVSEIDSDGLRGEFVPNECAVDTECGAFVQFGSIQFGDETVDIGETAIIDGASVFVAKAERVIVTNDSCIDGRAEVGRRLDVAITRRP